jgi:hypothetical protein
MSCSGRTASSVLIVICGGGASVVMIRSQYLSSFGACICFSNDDTRSLVFVNLEFFSISKWVVETAQRSHAKFPPAGHHELPRNLDVDYGRVSFEDAIYTDLRARELTEPSQASFSSLLGIKDLNELNVL